ncbi:hypothetical protein G6F65_020149 [Rhizopus arrhizus]|nr:hypothetical protein G6F23_015838 [Rhizopus arrhizus]KAG1247471.1 hypothetical protein G6F65_020149 [Rhizopus arrhizus]
MHAVEIDVVEAGSDARGAIHAAHGDGHPLVQVRDRVVVRDFGLPVAGKAVFSLGEHFTDSPLLAVPVLDQRGRARHVQRSAVRIARQAE